MISKVSAYKNSALAIPNSCEGFLSTVWKKVGR